MLILPYAMCEILYLNLVKTAHHVKSYVHRQGIKRARKSECRPFVSKVISMTKDKRLCSQARAIIKEVVDYIARLKMRSGGHDPLK